MPKPAFRGRDLVLVLVVGLLAGLLVGTNLPSGSQPRAEPSAGHTVTMELPAVDSHGNGVTTQLVVETKNGTGKTLANIDVLLFWVDTQQSIQAARTAAEKLTGVDTSSIDLIYGINANNISLVGGPSAGAALTIATIAALEGKQLAPDVMITGTIEDDGSIGPVGGVYEKARAAKPAGAKTFLVPPNESTETFTAPVETCDKAPGRIFCQTVYQTQTVDIGTDLGITVKEVSNVRDALPYFFR